MTAKDYYELAASAARDLEAIDAELSRIDQGTDAGGGHALTVPSGGTRRTDGVERAAIRRAQRTSELQERRAELIGVVDRADAIARKVGHALGWNYRLLLLWHYIDGETWEAVANELAMSLASVYRMRAAALAWVDDSQEVATM